MKKLSSYIKCITLNLRMLKFVCLNRWLSKDDYAKSYDKVAETYDSQWLCQLSPVTQRLLNALPECLDGDILDLGCGTGISTEYLESRYSNNDIYGLDISPEMLKLAAQKCSRTSFVEGDIIEFMQKRPNNSASLIFSGWAIGYSKPSLFIREAQRLLKPGGTLAFVVNYSDTLAPVFYAYRKCMNEFPKRVDMALWPKFPRTAGDLLEPLAKNGFETQLQEDGNIPIESPEGKITLEWLLKTGVLAGFDQVMPLHDEDIAKFFDEAMAQTDEKISHHYFMGIFKKADQ